jgi:hypothetical protein
MTSRWARLGPPIAAVWALGFAAVHAWWAVAGAPRFAPPGESFFPGGRVPVVLALLAAVVAMLIGSGDDRDRGPRGRWLLAGAGWLAGAGMIAYSFMFWASFTGYFGIGGMIAWAADANMDGRPLWWAVMVLPGYTVSGAQAHRDITAPVGRATARCSA